MKRVPNTTVDAVLAGESPWTVEHTDCLALLRSLPDNCIDSIVTDPPSGIGFMGKKWDSNKGGRKKWIAWLAKIMKEALRVLKPGGHALVWALPRTAHWTTTAVEDAGFEIRDVMVHLFGQGMPKNADASKHIDAMFKRQAQRSIAALDALDIQSLVDAWIEQSNRAPCAGFQFLRSPIETGTSTQKNASARVLVTPPASLKNCRALASDVAPFSSEARHTCGESCIVPGPAAASTVALSDHARYAELLPESLEPTASLPTTAHGSVLESVRERAGLKLTAAEALKTWLGSEPSSRVTTIAALCAALVKDLKVITLSRSDCFLSLDTSSKTGCVSATSVTITRSTAESLLSFTADTLRKQCLAALRRERPVVGSYMAGGNAGTSTADKNGTYSVGVQNSATVELKRTIGATEQSREWDGWGTALRPAAENWILARKPLIGTLAENLIEHGTGAINIDANRIPRNYDAEPDRPESWRKSGHSAKPDAEKIAAPPGVGIDLHPGGGWPANVVFSHDEECGDVCAAGCPVALLDEQSGEHPSGGVTHQPKRTGWTGGFSYGTYANRPPDTGTASRFFNVLRPDADPFMYEAKPATSERELGCDAFALKTASELVDRDEDTVGIKNGRAGAGRLSEGRRNNHPTLKSIALMRLLTRAVTRKGGVCLDLFTGSGTTGCACIIEGFRFIGAELNDSVEEPFASIARARITHVAGGSYVPREELRDSVAPKQRNLFEVSA